MLSMLHGFLFGKHLASRRTSNKRDFVDVGDALVVATYPRSGTTWMIRTLQELYAPTQEAEINSGLLNKGRIELGGGAYLAFRDNPCDCFSIIKTHMGWKEFFDTKISCKTVYVYRNVADVMLSYYFYTQHWIWGRSAEDVRFDAEEFMDFLEVHVVEWVEHVRSWVLNPEVLESGRVFFVKYEEMKKEFARALSNVAVFVGRHRSTTILSCRESVCSSQVFGNTNASFFRKGVCGDWKNYFSKHHVDFIDMSAGDVMGELGYPLCGSVL